MNRDIETIRAKHGKCYYCAGSIRRTPAHELTTVREHPDWLAHRDCLAAEAEEDAA